MSVNGWRSADRSRKDIQDRARVSGVRQGTKRGRLRFDVCGCSNLSSGGLDGGCCFAGERCRLRRDGGQAVRGHGFRRRRLGLYRRMDRVDFDRRGGCLRGRLHGRIGYWRFVKSGRIDERGAGERRRVRSGIGYR